MWARTASYITFFSLTLCSNAYAVERNEPRSQIIINHVNGTYTIITPDKAPRVESLETVQSFTIRPNEKVVIKIADPNLFYYKYSWESKESTSTPNAQAATTFAQSLFKVIGVLDSGAGKVGGGASFHLVKPQVMLAAYREQDMDSIDSSVNLTPSQEILQDTAVTINNASPDQYSMPTSSGETGVQKLVNDAVNQVENSPVPTPEDKVRPLLKGVGISDPKKFLQAFKGSVARIFLLSAQTQALVMQVDKGESRVAQSTIAGWDLPGLANTVNDSFEKMHQAADILGNTFSRDITEITDGENEICTLRQGVKAAITRLRGTGDPEGDTTRYRTLIEERVNLEASLERLRQQKDELRLNGLRSMSDREYDAARKRDLRALEDKLRSRQSPTAEEECQTVLFALDEEGINQAKAGLQALKDALEQDPFRSSISLVLFQEERTIRALDNLKQFAATMEKVGESYDLVTITYEDLKDGHGVFKISTLEEVRDLPRSLRPKRKITSDSFQFDFTPYSGAQLGVGIAAVYSFVKTHKFEAQAKSGSVVIVDTGGAEYSGADVAAMLTIVPRAWLASDTQGLFEVGVQPMNNIGIFAGTGFRFRNLFSVGVGAAFQQVEQLKTGLHTGDTIQNQSDIKTLKHFQIGAYLHLTVSTSISGKK